MVSNFQPKDIYLLKAHYFYFESLCFDHFVLPKVSKNQMIFHLAHAEMTFGVPARAWVGHWEREWDLSWI